MTNPCENCPLNLKPYKERKIGLKKSKKSNDIVVDGAVGTDLVYYRENLLKELPEEYRGLGKYFSMYVYKKDLQD